MLNWIVTRYAQIDADLPQVDAGDQQLQIIFNTVFAIMAAVAVLIIVIAGFRYVISRGDPQAVAKARNAIIYAAIGLVVIMTAYAIVALALNVAGG